MYIYMYNYIQHTSVIYKIYKYIYMVKYILNNIYLYVYDDIIHLYIHTEKEMAAHSSTLAWKIPWTEERGRLQSMGSQSRTRLSDFTHICTHTTRCKMDSW